MTKKSFAQRFWIIDNSGSMKKTVGNRIIDNHDSQNKITMIPCTRWEEIRECVNYHIQLAETVQAPTSFRFLNNPMNGVPKIFGIAGASGTDRQVACRADEAINLMFEAQPRGCTPLTKRIVEIKHEVSAMASQLQENGQRVAIIIATDGLPTGKSGCGGAAQRRDFVESLRGLEGLPVWVVIRLCTDDDDVVSFYNDLDSALELSIEVLDDFVGEAEEVYNENPWLNYALPLHRLREMGYHDRVFDMLDERKLSKSELRDFCAILFGLDSLDGVPDPSLDWVGFVKSVEILLQKEQLQWNPIKKRAKPWISLTKLNRAYGSSSCVIM